MKIPQSPISDAELDRHRFYGEVAAALTCLDAMIHDDKERILKSKAYLYEQLDKISHRLDRRAKLKPFEDMGARVGRLEDYKIQNHTAWMTGRTALFAAWILFSGIVTWTWTDLTEEIALYKDKVERQEKQLDALHDSINTLRTSQYREIPL